MRLNTIETRLAISGFLVLGLAGMSARADNNVLKNQLCRQFDYGCPPIFCQKTAQGGMCSQPPNPQQKPYNYITQAPSIVGQCEDMQYQTCNYNHELQYCINSYYMLQPPNTDCSQGITQCTISITGEGC